MDPGTLKVATRPPATPSATLDARPVPITVIPPERVRSASEQEKSAWAAQTGLPVVRLEALAAAGTPLAWPATADERGALSPPGALGRLAATAATVLVPVLALLGLGGSALLAALLFWAFGGAASLGVLIGGGALVAAFIAVSWFVIRALAGPAAAYDAAAAARARLLNEPRHALHAEIAAVRRGILALDLPATIAGDLLTTCRDLERVVDDLAARQQALPELPAGPAREGAAAAISEAEARARDTLAGLSAVLGELAAHPGEAEVLPEIAARIERSRQALSRAETA